MPVQDIDRRHDHAGRAETTLQRVVVPECNLHRMELASLCNPLDRRDARAVGLPRQNHARFCCPPVNVAQRRLRTGPVATYMSPVRFRLSRSICTNSVRSPTSTETALPFAVNAT
jgi:hypothetical protein